MSERIRVLCVTPSGLAGRGGIDRLYLYLRTAGTADALTGIDLRFGAARGAAPGPLWPLAFPARLLALAAQMRAFRPDIVHINFANRGSAVRKLAVLHLAERFGARTIVHLHDSLPEGSLARRGRAGRLFLSICSRADRVVVLGRAAAEAVARHGVPTAKVRVLLNGIPDFAGDLTLPKPAREPVPLLLAGKVGDHKGVGVLIDALAILRDRGIHGWRCTIAGDGTIDVFRAKAEQAGLADRIHFTGWVGADAVHALMREAAIVVLPSRAEALPLSLAEGACAGAALVSTPVGNVAEIVRDGETGRLVEREPQALADALAALLTDRTGLGRMQVAARRRYREALTIDAFAAGLRALYAELTPGAGVTVVPRQVRGRPVAAPLDAV